MENELLNKVYEYAKWKMEYYEDTTDFTYDEYQHYSGVYYAYKDIVKFIYKLINEQKWVNDMVRIKSTGEIGELVWVYLGSGMREVKINGETKLFKIDEIEELYEGELIWQILNWLTRLFYAIIDVI